MRKPLSQRSLHLLRYRPLFPVFLLVGWFVLCPVGQAQTVSTLVPSSYVTISGTDGGQAASTSIDILDESGTTNTWNKYVEFQTTSNATYVGYQVFSLGTSIPPSSVTGLQVKVNYQGPDTGTQTWTWQIYDWIHSSYATIGTNAGAPSWGAWTILTFNVSGTLANYVRASDGEIRLQLLSSNNADNTDIDYEAVVVTSSNGVSVSISPTSASLNGGGTQPFTATVTGSSNTAVTWSLTGPGTLSTSGLYTAPVTISNQTTATVKATSQADTTKSASAVVTLNPVVVSISPTSATLNGGGTQQFKATVTGSSNAGVTWSLSGSGTLSSSGLYTAPATISSQSTATVTATSQADTTKSASATITLNSTSVSVTISPTSATLGGGGTQQFTSAVTGSSNTAVTWSETGPGSVTTGGLYTAPAMVSSQTTATVTATSQADATKSASATVTINPVAIGVSPTTASLGANQTQQFTATVTGTTNPAATWSLSGLGTLSGSGLYTAPSTISSKSTATVTATSQEDTTKSASATVTLNPTAGMWIPPLVTSWQWQLQGTLDTKYKVQMYDIDGFNQSASDVSTLHAQGAHVVCYLSVGTYENWRPDASQFPKSVIGKSNGWPGENWLDIRQISILGPIMDARFQMCKQKGFDAIEPDNIDGYANNTGFPLTQQDQINYDTWLSNDAHKYGLSIGLKNDPANIPNVINLFDWALNEQCNEYGECSNYDQFVSAGKAVFNAEYNVQPPTFCPYDNAHNLNGLFLSINLDDSVRTPCRGN